MITSPRPAILPSASWSARLVGMLLGTTCFAAPSAHAQTPAPHAPASLNFVAIGDTPYSAEENRVLKTQVAAAIRADPPAFVVHYGDFKDGSSDCSVALLTERRNDIYRLLPGRVFYTPGDNEWADCDRAKLQHPVSKLAMLDQIHKLFFTAMPRVPAELSYARQDNFPENARWSQDGILFVTLHQISSNNGRKDILKDDVELTLAMVNAREQANRVWLDQAFQYAQTERARAVVVISHADITDNLKYPACSRDTREQCDAFSNFRRQLRLLARDFRESPNTQRKPVLFLHGDTNPYCWDKNFGMGIAPNLWRLNAWGDFQQPADATAITVSPDDAHAPFSARTLIGRQLPAQQCG